AVGHQFLQPAPRSDRRQLDGIGDGCCIGQPARYPLQEAKDAQSVGRHAVEGDGPDDPASLAARDA
ncbi:hypothetical protein, partial [Salmonella sp. SAL4433]|uniref:hypothetical protein n=1 Tax=Salmonella sp. SAL4433 TaxID=3159888 RepID=UPI00397C9C64